MTRSGAIPDRILTGDRSALARALTLVEEGGEEAAVLLDALQPRIGRARRVGLTGPPGAGKSTLAAGLLARYRAEGKRIGVVAVDPTSPLSGGALLGDRHRVGGHALDEGVFFRSFASRGSAGGLARAAPDALDLLDAAGFDLLLVETVGVGQSEIEVATAADTVALILSPESGDAVQAMKAGLLEIADVLCVNKADREGADAFARELEAMLDRRAESPWRPPVVLTEGKKECTPLFQAISTHGAWLAGNGRLAERRRKGMRDRLRRLAGLVLCERLLAGEEAEALVDREAVEVEEGRRSPRRAAERIALEVAP